jgi:cytochrome c
MSGLELNKIIAAILLAALVAMLSGHIADALYHPEMVVAKRGFEVEGVATSTAGGAPVEVAEVVIKIGQLLAKADVAAGEAGFKRCATCHNNTKGAGAKIGPNLWDIVGHKKAGMSDYTYSTAMASKGGEWSFEELFHFLNNPQKFAKGTKMTFAGIKKPDDIANILAYLNTLSDSPRQLPPVED